MSAAEIVVRVASPSLIVLVGAAGSGKTTLAARLFEPDDVLSSDALRAAVSGDAADQDATRSAFSILHREVARRLAIGRLVVVDATSVERHARRSLLRLAAAAGVRATAIVLALPGDQVHAQNRGRAGRSVPTDVVDRHLERIAGWDSRGNTTGIVETLSAEGFASVVVVRSAEQAASLRIVRVSRP